DDSGLLGQTLWDHLKTLPVIEGFPARPGAAGYMAEISRLALRKRLAETQRGRFIDLNGRLVRLLAADTRAAGRIEWIYHLLVADTEQGIAELAELNHLWTAEGRQEDLEALVQVLTELNGAGLLQGRAQAWARLITAQGRADVAGASSLGNDANHILAVAEVSGDQRLEADAQSLVGNVMEARGDLAAAEYAYRQALTIAQQLGLAEPGNAGRQLDLASAYSQVGEVAEERGDLEAAEQAFGEGLAICERMSML